LLAPREERTVRRALWLYLLSSTAFFLVPNPVGGNMVRLAAIFAGPVAAYYLMRYGRVRALALVALPLVGWQFAAVPGAVASGHGNPSAQASYYAGLVNYLHRHGALGSRVEVPLTVGRWEADYLATKVALARGWERQVDLGSNAVLYQPTLTASDYQAWLVANDVDWVALPDVSLDPSEAGERALLTGAPLPFLVPAWSDAHWRLWRVLGSPPLLSGPAQLLSVDVNVFRLQARGAGFVTVRLHWTRFWQVTEGRACVAPTPDGWTSVQLFGPGPVTVTAKVGLGQLAGADAGGSCGDVQPPS
jgi:hypothetical protein